MKLLVIRFENEGENMTPELFAAIKNAWVGYGNEPKLTEEGKLEYTWSDYLMRADLMPLIPYRIVRVIDTGDILALNTAPGTVVNQKVHVAVPGFGLMQINKVEVALDMCTEMLQGRLDAGWRILAICPQPDQRRPDYVLGRTVTPEEA
jgi:hypothetical protein